MSTDKTEQSLPQLLERAVSALMECDRDGDYPLIAELEAASAALTAAPPAQPQSELLEMDLLRTDFKRECDDTDMILRMLGLEPENCRTDGGSLKINMILDALEARDRLIRRAALAAQPPERAAQQEAQEALTDEQIGEAWDLIEPDWPITSTGLRFARTVIRAYEAARGIGKLGQG